MYSMIKQTEILEETKKKNIKFDYIRIYSLKSLLI